MDDTTVTTLMNKKAKDITVGDSLKITVLFTAVAVAIPVTFALVAGGVSKLAAWNMNRKANKVDLTLVES